MNPSPRCAFSYHLIFLSDRVIPSVRRFNTNYGIAMTDDQFKQLIAAIKALQKHLEENDNSTAIGSIETDVAKIQKDIAELKKSLGNR